MNPILPLQGRITGLSSMTQPKNASQISFQDFLQTAQEKEASKNEDLARLQSAVDKLAQKGARESLIYMQEVALVVSVANRTVITALEKLQVTDNIITNIDSAAII